MEIIEALKKGKYVKRPCWQKDSYWKSGKNGRICWKDNTIAHIHLNQIKGIDWEIVEKRKSLSDKRLKWEDIHAFEKNDMQDLLKLEDVEKHLKDFIDWLHEGGYWDENEKTIDEAISKKAKECFGEMLIYK